MNPDQIWFDDDDDDIKSFIVEYCLNWKWFHCGRKGFSTLKTKPII